MRLSPAATRQQSHPSLEKACGRGRANRRHRGQGPMDQRIESFLGDVLALAGEEPDAVPEGVRRALAGCEAIFRLQEASRPGSPVLPQFAGQLYG